MEKTAEVIEEAIRPITATPESNIPETEQFVQAQISGSTAAVSEETQQRWNNLSVESPTRTRDAVIARLQQVCLFDTFQRLQYLKKPHRL